MIWQQLNNLFVESVRRDNKIYQIRYDWSEIFLVLSVFSKFIGSTRIFGVDFDLISYPFFVLYFVIYLKRVMQANAKSIWAPLFVVGASLFSIFYLNLSYSGFLKQIFAVLVIYMVANTIISRSDVTLLFRLYVRVTFWTAIFGILQVMLSYVGIMILTITVGRLNSVAYEPSHYAAILIPALVFAFFHYKEYKKEFVVMLIALILTFNLTGYLVFLLILAFSYLNLVYIIVAVPVLYFIVFYGLANLNTNFNLRIADTLSVFSGKKEILNFTTKVNGTTTSFYSNLIVALNNVRQNFLTGVGLGGHDEAYFRYYQDSMFRFNYFYGLNSQSAHSLSIRILSEFGLVGFVIYVVTLVRNVIINDKGYYSSISLGCLSHFLCKTLKLGGYIDYGTPFFLVMLLVNFSQYKKGNQEALA